MDGRQAQRRRLIFILIKHLPAMHRDADDRQDAMGPYENRGQMPLLPGDYAIYEGKGKVGKDGLPESFVLRKRERVPVPEPAEAPPPETIKAIGSIS
jgi:hypothetical protein